MLQTVTAFAPAKINVGLRVLQKRADGYHNIESIFSTINLYDEIHVFVEEDFGCVVKCEGMILPSENTFTQTYKAFCVLTGIKQGVRVLVKKNIPAGGGLGGGSSDCASFLFSLDTLFGTQLGNAALLNVAGAVGSDVYFFVEALLAQKNDMTQKSFVALVTGRGEEVTQIAGRSDYVVLLVFPGVFVSTKEAYSLVDEAKAQNKNICPSNLEQMYKKPVREWFFKNDFTAPVSGRYSQIATALLAVKRTGADFVDMSGSGSTVFGIFQEQARAERAFQELAKHWRTVLV